VVERLLCILIGQTCRRSGFRSSIRPQLSNESSGSPIFFLLIHAPQINNLRSLACVCFKRIIGRERTNVVLSKSTPLALAALTIRQIWSLQHVVSSHPSRPISHLFIPFLYSHQEKQSFFFTRLWFPDCILSTQKPFCPYYLSASVCHIHIPLAFEVSGFSREQ
jgi:hypothetical protein